MNLRVITSRRLLYAAAILSLCFLAENHSQGQSSCGPTVNVVVCENLNPGTPDTVWDVNGAGDGSIQGFATDISVAPGQLQQFKVDTTAAGFSMAIYRLGYYGGMGARFITNVSPTIAKNQSNCLNDAATGLIDCGNWTVSASWTVPATAVSGIYFARIARNDNGGASQIFFVVRESDTASHHSDMVFQTSDTTWQAYNQYGGNSLYSGSPVGRAYKVSYNRPLTVRDSIPEDSPFNAEYPMVRWLEANGYDVSYMSGVDTDRRGSSLLQHKVYLSVGHDEYWSGAQRANVEAARAAGVHLAFFSGNEVFWKTRWESSIDGSGTPYRTLVTYKETHANAKIDPQDPPTWTGTWGDPRFSPPADGGRPQNGLTGQMFGVNAGDTTAMTIPAAFGKHRFWRNTSVATLAAGTTATLPAGTLGYEWDIDVDNGFQPNRLMKLSQTTKSVVGKLLDYGSTFGPGTVTHTLTLYRVNSGALVFGAGTVQWSWGLDSDHDRGSTAPDVRMRQATVNLFADMGVQPATLQSGLVPASASADALPPTSTITAPTNGASFPAGTPVTITGTAAEVGGGVVAGVEVSTDGGTTWKQATGTTSWSFGWDAAGSGSVTIKSRAFDDTGNVEIPAAGVNVTVTGSGTCPCTIWSASVVPPAPLDDFDTSSVELGTKFRTDSSGFITGVRFYKGTANTGTHTGSLWTSTGVSLGTVTFGSETASGWQQAIFPNAIPVTANTTYVVSYHAPNGHYTGTDGYFLTAVDKPPLHALRDGTDGGNGVYAYGTTASFPSSTFNAENYWVDVLFTTVAPPDSTAPTVTSRSPAVGATGVLTNASITATFSEALDPSTVSSSTTGSEGGGSFGTVELRDPQGNLVNVTVTYDAPSKTATMAPKVALALATTYTATIKGGGTDPRVKDLAGNALASNVVWSFTTSATPPPPPPPTGSTIWSSSAVPSPIDDNDPTSVELGTKFRSDLAGYIVGARFYKGPLNTGIHIASLWTSTGTKLATATFTGETASGWQSVGFPTPVQIAPNTTYVISYHAPNGHYSAPDNYFASAGVDNPPLHALRNGVDGPNGLYLYGSTPAFPTNTSSSEGYFVDVIFATTAGNDVTPPSIVQVAPAAGAIGVPATNNVTVTFNELLDASTVTGSTLVLRDPSNAIVPGAVTYNAFTVTLTPTSPLAYSTQYSATLSSGIKDLNGNATTAPFAWSFTTTSPPPPPPIEGPGGPILVVTTPANPFSTYLAEILRGEGVNAFERKDLSQVTGTVLDGYDVVILGEAPLTSAQVTMFSNWVNAGGNLIAMRPDKQLAGLMGLTDAAATLPDAYLLVNTASGPGVGIVNQTIQFHGTADRYTLNGAAAVATLYSTATTATVNPAVTMRTVGAGRAVAFTYDLARSVVYTRQGNPAWAGQERDGQSPPIIRSDDLFFGDKAGDSKPDYVDLNKVAIPQADEQQRLLWNIILNVNASKKPLPKFWYFPRMLPAVVIMTGDDHAQNGTAGRFQDFIAASAANCSVQDWGCIRGTSYIFPGTPISDGQVASYKAMGFEIALHVNTDCANWTPASLTNYYTTQLAQFAGAWPSAGAPTTNRTHCIVWSDWSTQAQVELNNGIRLDTNYYYWPNSWVLDRPGVFTGSGMPQRFASLTGTMIDVYQATTQMTDESGQTFPKNIDTLLNNATGPLGYYGAFTANMHTDANPSPSETAAMAIVNSAKARNIPVITSKQALEWLDGRNASSFQGIAWNGSVLSFNIAVATGANGLRALVPAVVGTSPLTGITYNGAPLSFATQTIKGISYATFAAAPGAYQVNYGPDVTAPVITSIGAVPSATSSTITWSTSEPSDTVVTYGTVATTLNQTANNAALVAGHSIVLPGLSPNTTYFFRVSSGDAAGNRTVSPAAPSSPLSFTTSALSISGTIAPLGAATTVSLTGPSTATTSTDAAGNYVFPGLPAGAYTVTPAKTGYTFSPQSRSVTLTNAVATSINFAGQAVTISGTVSPATSGAGATVTLSGPMNAVTTADGSGNFSFAGIADGTYSIAVTRTGFTFTPASQSVTVTASTSVAGVAFTGQPLPTWTISGTIAGGSGASVALSGTASGSTTADGSGNYSFTGLSNGTYTVTPTKTGFTVSPASQTVPVSGANVPGINFTAQPLPTWTISGTITPAGTGSGSTVTLTGPATATVTADAGGAYSFAGLLNGTYTVTPTKSGITMTPANRSVTVAGASVSAVNFTAAVTPVTIAIDATVTLGRSTKATTIVSPAFSTTTTNQLVLAFVAADNISAAATTVTGVTGGGLTWVLVRRTNTEKGTSEIWRTFAPSALTGVTATATLSQSVAAAITIVSVKGVDTSGTSGSGAIGATASANAASGAPTASLTTTRANSLVIGVGNDWDNATARTVGPGQVLVSQYLATVGDTFWVQRMSATTPAAGTVVTINDVAPTGDRFNLTICEILGGS